MFRIEDYVSYTQKSLKVGETNMMWNDLLE